MTPLETMIADVKSWAIRPDYSDAIVESFIRTAEANLSRSLRVAPMVKIADASILDSQKRVPLPNDWRELIVVRVNNGRPLTFREISSFYDDPDNNCGRYTIVGSYIEVGDVGQDPSGLPVEVSYFANAPHLGEEPNWLFTHYYDMYLQSCLVAAFSYSVELEKASMASTIVSGWIADANAEYTRSQVSGSNLLYSKVHRRK